MLRLLKLQGLLKLQQHSTLVRSGYGAMVRKLAGTYAFTWVAPSTT